MDSYLESLVQVTEFEAKEEVADEVVVEEEPVVESPEVAEPIEEKKEEELVEEEEPVLSVPDPSNYKEGDIIKVENIKVFKTPDKRQISRNVTGNVTYLGKIGEYTIINYMRHGFGLVKGYTPDI